MKCNTIIDGKYKKYNNNCWTIIGYLWEVFERAEMGGYFIDFLFEMPFFYKSRLNNLDVKIANMNEFSDVPRNSADYENIVGHKPNSSNETESLPALDGIRELFWNCFFPRESSIRRSCPFNNTRFHYIDIRQYFTDLRHKPIKNEIYIFSIYINERLKNLNNLLCLYEGDELPDNYQNFLSNEFKLIEILIRNFYFIPKGTRHSNAFLYFHLCLTSNNFKQDTEELFNDMFLELEIFGVDNEILNEIKHSLLNNNIITIRKKFIVHKIRAQLIKLEDNGEFNLVNNIITFYEDRINDSNLYSYYLDAIELYEEVFEIGVNKKQSENFYQLIDQVENILTDGELFYETYLLDVYTLGRMFNTHENNSIIRIIYAGANHSRNINNFLKKELGIKMTEHGNLKLSFDNGISRCLEVDTNLFLP